MRPSELNSPRGIVLCFSFLSITRQSSQSTMGNLV